ncbi:hypothetical protein F4808DRAFT_29819 [Astrocystis sublimbata]|nr:hypothetical protein F4808DRAFT_29819 [Astrocystis sublimbata]
MTSPTPASTSQFPLSNELVLSILESDLPSAALAACALTCKNWNRLATAILYKHVTLTTSLTLARWSAAAPPRLDATIQSLTMCITKVQTAMGPETPATTMERLQESLDRLEHRINGMSNLKSLSITTPKKLTRGLWVPNPAIAKVLDNLPSTCLSLELVVRNGPFPPTLEHTDSHLCIAIRRLMPSLEFARLALPSLCSECFGSSLVDLHTGNPIFNPLNLSKLRELIVVLASPKLGNRAERFDKPCTPDSLLTGMTAVVQSLESVVSSGNAPAMTKSWVYDCLPAVDDDGYSYGAFVRRDILAHKSYTFPWNDIAPLKRVDSFCIRMPAEERGGEDMITTRDNAACLVERHAWLTATNGARLPSALVDTYGFHEKDCPVQDRDEWFASSGISTALWKNENETGMRLLEGESGDLLEDRPAVFHIPQGWQRRNLGFIERVSTCS